MMRTLMVFCCVLMLGLTLTPDMAEAKRFGGGGSFGKMFSTPKKVSPTRQTAPKAAPTSTTGKAATGSKRPGMGGMLGGLLAGGLLGAMFMGGAFEGIQMMDILIIAVIGFVLFKLFAGAKAPRTRQPQYAGHPEPEVAATRSSTEPFASGGAWGQGDQAVELELPAWFDKTAFLEGSSNHFAQLQQAWSQNDLVEIRSYCSPELFDALEAERAGLGEGVLDNDLVSVVPELVGFAEADGQAQVSILFNGWMREGAEAETTEFNEIWHLTRDLSAEGADWFIVGIEQAG